MGPRVAPPRPGETLTVFAAASLQEAFDELLADFAADRPGLKVAPAVYDGSSTLVTQLVEGAEADMLATANESTMADAVDAGVMTGEPALFASNDLVIAVPASNPHGIAARPELIGISPAAAQIVNLYPLGTTSQAAIGAEFVEYVLSEAGQAVLASYCFGTP